MSRAWFGSWGAELDEKSFANAVAELGTVSSSDSHSWSWLLERELATATAPADGLAAAWLLGGGRPRISVADRGPFEARWLADVLRRATGVESVVFAADPPREPRRWDWPLDVALLDDPRGRAMRDRVRAQYWSQFVRFVHATRTSSPIEILMLPCTLAEALAALPTLPRLPEIHTVLVTGGTAGTRDPVPSLHVLRTVLGAAVAVAADIPDDDANRWLDSMLFSLSHDHPLDHALFDAATGTPPPLILGAPSTFESARASAVARRLGRTLDRRLHGATASTLPASWMNRLKLDAGASLSDFAERLDREAHALDWHSEGEAATDVVQLADVVDQAPPTTPLRFLQARLQRGGRRGMHRLDVRIGGRDADWSQPSQAFPSPPEPEEAQRLAVVFVEPKLFPRPQHGHVVLPPDGDSTVWAFHFRLPRDVDRIDGRVTVLYRNRILQAVRVRGTVTALLRNELTIELEAAVRGFGGLGGSPGFDTALYFNERHHADGVTAYSDGATAYVNLRNIDGFVKNLRGELEKITRTPADYQQTDSEATRALLVTLARLGSQMLTGLRELPGMGAALPTPSARNRRLQVFSIHPDEVVPLELGYERTFPDANAVLCPSWREALGRGDCLPACPANSRKHVCPLGFWGLRHVIERVLFDADEAQHVQHTNAELRVRSHAIEGHRPMTAVARVLMAYADRAKNFDAAGFQDAVDEMHAVLDAHRVAVKSADTWDGWTSSVKDDRPGLLLLMPHTDFAAGAPTLEIGHDTIAVPAIDVTHVADPPSEPPTPGPVVLLLGCRTAADDIPFASTVGAFRRAHASVVVATLSTVRGRHTARVARHAIELFAERARSEQPSSMGELIVELRRRLLAADLPVAMTFIAFGDVDWLLGGPTS